MAHYTLFRSKATVNDNDVNYKPVQNPSECASRCDNELSIHCRSFNYCPTINACYLSDRHLDDGSQTSTTSSSNSLYCDHYSSINEYFLFYFEISFKNFF